MVHIILASVTEFGAALLAVQAKQVAATGAATGKALHLIERRTKEKLATTSHKRGEPTPSMPGEPPSLVSGALRRSAQVEGPSPMGPISWEGSVGPTMEYGRIQELGGSTGRSELPARPYLSPAFDEALPEIAEIYAEAWAAALGL